jgi:AraC family transcriptional regulator
MQPTVNAIRIEAQAASSVANVLVSERTWTDNIDFVCESRDHLLQFQLLPRMPQSHDSRVRFGDRWQPHHFEPLGSAFFIPAGQSMHVKSQCRRAVTVTCIFSPESIESWLAGRLQWTESRLKRCLNITHPTIHNLMFRLSEELRAPGFAGDTLIELLTSELLVEFARYSMGVEERRTRGGLAQWRLRLIDERLADASSRPSLTELANLCNLSARQLTRAFRISRGCSIGSYIVQTRIDRAKQLLRTDQNVKSIAYALGFNSPSHFYMAFHRATGETPRQYRERVGRSTSPA